MIPEKAIELAKHFEGFQRKKVVNGTTMAFPYLCPAGHWTIGYGHLCKPMQFPITEEQADEILRQDLLIAVTGVLKYCPGLVTDANRLSAITDFAFNLGIGRLQASTLRRRINEQDWDGAKTELMKWVHGGGKILPGLVLRRKAEADLL